MRYLLTLLTVALLTGCAIDPSTYSGEEPRMRIEEYFAGQTRGWGLVQSRSGKVERRFVVDLHGNWEGDEFVLRESFRYDDGKAEQREWRIRVIDEHRYEGRAADVRGVASGEAYGSALNWRYTLEVPVGKRVWALSFNDWMYLHEDGVLINRAEFSKFGVRLGEVTITFAKSW